jgi:hypothetical protein
LTKGEAAVLTFEVEMVETNVWIEVVVVIVILSLRLFEYGSIIQHPK